jgi:superfamily II DNA or RNA helicase
MFSGETTPDLDLSIFYQRKSFNAIADILDNVVLSNFQTIDVMKLLYYKAGIVAYDTGLGKTLIAAAIMRCLLNEDSSRRFIMFVKKDQLLQTPEKLSRYCSIGYFASTAEKDNIEYLLRNRIESPECLILTHECLNNEKIMFNIFLHKDVFCGVFVDEAHMLSNWKVASSAFMLRSLLLNFEYRYFLTATPIVRDEQQLTLLLMMLDRELFKRAIDISGLRRDLDEDILARIAELIIARDRESVGAKGNYRSKIVYINPHRHQLIKERNIMVQCKGPGAVNQVRALKELLFELKGRGKKGLVYINQYSIRDWVIENLADCGFKYKCVNGQVKGKERLDIFEEFGNDELDFIITSITMALDLDSDYVIFYEFTEFVQQMIGRAHRGLEPKDLEIYFLFTKHSREVIYFLENTYRKSLLIRDLLGKNLDELIDIGKELMDSEYDYIN